MVTIAHFAGLLLTDAEHIELDVEQWLDSLVVEPNDNYAGQMYHSGWSPAEYDPPKRALANVKRIHAVVLDHDDNGDWERLVTLWTGSSGALYTTKSHAVAHPRYRVVLALSRPVTATEYSKLWDWAATRSADAGCAPDRQCKDASRFWYDPSRPPGGWKAERLRGTPIDPDSILARAVEQPRLSVVRPRSAPTTGDRERRARAYLAKIPGAISGQEGHLATWNTVAAVMVGFDLTTDETRRLIVEDYNPRCDPPWSEREIEHKLADVAKRCERQRGYLLGHRDTAQRQVTDREPPDWPTDIDATPSSEEVNWDSLLLTKADRSPRKAYHNTAVLVRHHPEFRSRWSYNIMTGSPWLDGKPMQPEVVHYIRARADCTLGFTPSAPDVEAAIVTAAKENQFHPVLKYLRSLDWDGIPRLSAMARDYFGAPLSLHADMVRKFMIGAAARALWPGCKLDTTLMLVGAQGWRKSSFFAVLGGEWHADTHIDITNKDAALQLHSAWLYELSELENVVTGARESRIKAWITSTHDLYRPPYGRVAERRARSCAICGTTNHERFLTDNTGSRRYHCIPVRQPVPVDLLIEMRDQLWAEAVCAAESGEPWWFSDQKREHERDEANRQFEDDDSWADPIRLYLASSAVAVGGRVTMTEVLEGLGIRVQDHDKSAQIRAGKALKSLGWERRRDGHGNRQWAYHRMEQQISIGEASE